MNVDPPEEPEQPEKTNHTSEPTAATPRKDLPDEPTLLVQQLKHHLRGLNEDRLSDPAGEEPLRQALTLLKHAQTVVWRSVARGDLAAPKTMLAQLRHLLRYVDLHTPTMPPASRAAVEIRSAVTAFFIADQSLAEIRSEASLQEKERSVAEREILRVLTESPQSYLRRGQIHKLIEGKKPSLPRVGQILAQLTSEGLLKRIHATAQGNPRTAHYGLSPFGHEVCQKLQIFDRAKGQEVAVASSLKGVMRNLYSPAKDQKARDRRRISQGLLSQMVFRSNRHDYLDVVRQSYKQAKGRDHRRQTKQARRVLNGMGAGLAATSVMHVNERGGLAFKQDPERWQSVPERLRTPPVARRKAPKSPSTTVPQLSVKELERLYTQVPPDPKLALLETVDEVLESVE